MSGLYVHYGCGFCAPDDWLNFDCSPTARFERIPVLGRLYTKNAKRFPVNIRYGDIVRGLPVPDASCQAVYSSHVLDTLCFKDGKVALRNTRKILTPGGIFRVVVEDCSRFMTDYLANSSPDAALRFMETIDFGRMNPRTINDFLKEYFGHPCRLWMWDFPSLSHNLKDAGFHSIRRAAFGDCDDPHFASVEEKGRWDDAIGVECRA